MFCSLIQIIIYMHYLYYSKQFHFDNHKHLVLEYSIPYYQDKYNVLNNIQDYLNKHIVLDMFRYIYVVVYIFVHPKMYPIDNRISVDMKQQDNYNQYYLLDMINQLLYYIENHNYKKQNKFSNEEKINNSKQNKKKIV